MKKTKYGLSASILLLHIFFAVGCSAPSPSREAAAEERPRLHRRAIVAFSFSPHISEDWNWIFHEVHTRCATEDLVVYQAPPKSEVIKNLFPEDPHFRLDLRIYKKGVLGYLFVESGREIRFQQYDLSGAIINNAREYFGEEVCGNRK